MQEVSQNIKAMQVGNNLVIVIDTTQNLGQSSTGKMNGIGNTNGFTALPGNLKGNIYVGKKA
jgi:hypothetical protein